MTCNEFPVMWKARWSSSRAIVGLAWIYYKIGAVSEVEITSGPMFPNYLPQRLLAKLKDWGVG